MLLRCFSLTLAGCVLVCVPSLAQSPSATPSAIPVTELTVVRATGTAPFPHQATLDVTSDGERVEVYVQNLDEPVLGGSPHPACYTPCALHADPGEYFLVATLGDAYQAHPWRLQRIVVNDGRRSFVVTPRDETRRTAAIASTVFGGLATGAGVILYFVGAFESDGATPWYIAAATTAAAGALLVTLGVWQTHESRPRVREFDRAISTALLPTPGGALCAVGVRF